MRNVSVPIGIKIPGKPNIADTLWLTVSDQRTRSTTIKTRTARASFGQSSTNSTLARAPAHANCNSMATQTSRAIKPRTSSQLHFLSLSCQASRHARESHFRLAGVFVLRLFTCHDPPRTLELFHEVAQILDRIRDDLTIRSNDHVEWHVANSKGSS